MNFSSQSNGQSGQGRQTQDEAQAGDSAIPTITTTDTVIAVDHHNGDAQATVTEISPSSSDVPVHPFSDTQPSDPSVASLFTLLQSSHIRSSTSDTTNNLEGYSPTLQPRRLSGHQQSNIPYLHSIRNEYPVYPSGYRTPDGTGHGHGHGHGHGQGQGSHSAGHSHGHHSHHGQHSSHQHHRGGVLAAIDYEGLDACINEVALEEKDFMESQPHVSTPLINAKEFSDKDSKEYPRSLHRAASTGSTSAFGSGFRRRSARKASFYGERAPRPPLPEQIRYTYYSRTTGLIQEPSLPRILSTATQQSEPGAEGPSVFSDLLKDGCFWIDILDPSDLDMQICAKYFHVHPLTIEDISTEEVREKYEVFRNYYFVCFRTFDQDYNSGSYLQPVSIYCVVLREGIITFHFRPTNHHLNVLRRLEQFHSHITLTPDWINYALLDDITDSFASPIQTIEYEVDSIDELVLLLRENETSDMLRRIGSCRKNVMAISRLLTNKADVIRGLMKRFDERYLFITGNSSGGATGATGATGPTGMPIGAQQAPVEDSASHVQQQQQQQQQQYHRDGEMLLYLGDILDHVLTMIQSLSSYEKILARSHSNYLAQISLEINQLSNKTNSVVGTLTFFASLIVPMTFIAGLWGMNIHVPGDGNDEAGLHWWWGILGFMLAYCIAAVIFGRHYGLI
ncbi:CorA metal ion transporter [Podila epicladia]|nr:CorA metal ion transporter [Podila epicladia]KAG0089007.1 CorA metal ion transporter [Podila epicladia]